jgi:hypothetical protein
MAMDTGSDPSTGSSVVCLLPFLFFFLGFLTLLVDGSKVKLSLLSFLGSSGMDTGDTDFFGVSGVRQGLLRISVTCGCGCFASFSSKEVEEVVEEAGRS